MDTFRREAGTRKLRGQRHCEASRVSCAKQLLRIGRRLSFFKSRLEGVWTSERSATDFQSSATFSKIALPFRFSFPDWHKSPFNFPPSDLNHFSKNSSTALLALAASASESTDAIFSLV